jgi:glycosyltransferase involved in cell wall biosynthesis
MKPELVTAILPVADASRLTLARKAVNNFVRQYYRPFELIVVNATGQAVLTNEQMRHSENVLGGVVREFRVDPGLPVGAMRNVGIREAAGDWIFPIDDDDFMHPMRLMLQMAARQPHSAVTLRRQLRIDISEVVATREGAKPLVFVHEEDTGIPETILFPAKLGTQLSLYDDSLETGEQRAQLGLFDGKVIVVDNRETVLTTDIAWSLMSVAIWHGKNLTSFDYFFRNVPRPIERGAAISGLSASDLTYLRQLLAHYNFVME